MPDQGAWAEGEKETSEPMEQAPGTISQVLTELSPPQPVGDIGNLLGSYSGGHNLMAIEV